MSWGGRERETEEGLYQMVGRASAQNNTPQSMHTSSSGEWASMKPSEGDNKCGRRKRQWSTRPATTPDRPSVRRFVRCKFGSRLLTLVTTVVTKFYPHNHRKCSWSSPMHQPPLPWCEPHHLHRSVHRHTHSFDILALQAVVAIVYTQSEPL